MLVCSHRPGLLLSGVYAGVIFCWGPKSSQVTKGMVGGGGILSVFMEEGGSHSSRGSNGGWEEIEDGKYLP